MNQRISKALIAAIVAITVGAPMRAAVQSKTIIVETPSDLPEAARVPTEALYLHHTGQAQAILYLEQDQGRKLAILDVTDPAKIRSVGQVSLNAPAPYEFVQDLGSARTLIHYHDHSGFAVISFTNYKVPVLTPEPEYLHPASAQADGDNGVLLVSNSASTRTASKATAERRYEVLSVSSGGGATPLATIQNVIQRVDRPQTGTIFLLTDQGVTVVRCLAAERQHQTNVWQKDEN